MRGIVIGFEVFEIDLDRGRKLKVTAVWEISLMV